MNKWYEINNLSEFIDSTRTLVFNHFGSEINQQHSEDLLLAELSKEEKQELDEILSHDESMIIAKAMLKKQKHKTTKAIRYMVSDQLFIDIISALNDRMVSNLLNSLVNKGYLESAYDSETNDFVFWTTKENDDAKEPPKT